MLTDRRKDGRMDGRKVITIAHPEQSSGHPEQSSGELKKTKTFGQS